MTKNVEVKASELKVGDRVLLEAGFAGTNHYGNSVFSVEGGMGVSATVVVEGNQVVTKLPKIVEEPKGLGAVVRIRGSICRRYVRQLPEGFGSPWYAVSSQQIVTWREIQEMSENCDIEIEIESEGVSQNQ